MKIYVFDTEKEVDQFAGKHICHYIQTHVQPVIGFATGLTPLGTYDYMIESYQKGETDFSNVIAFNLDEYVGIEKTHPRSFATAMHDYLFSKINIDQDNIHALDGKALVMEEECKRYEKEISDHPIAIQILGIGMDGHIAYNEPGSSFESTCHVVDLYPESIKSSLDYGFSRIEDVPTQGVSQGIATIMKANQLIMIAKGKKKASLVERMIHGEVSKDFPSSIIQKHENVIVVLDKAAASCLEEAEYERC